MTEKRQLRPGDNPPVVIRIGKHSGKSGRFRLIRKEYTNIEKKMFTKTRIGYYKTADGVVNRAISEAERYANGDYVVGKKGPERPVRIAVTDDTREKLGQHADNIPDEFDRKLEPYDPEEDEE